MKRLIVNADDFGFTRGTNEGIVRAFKDGIVTSTTLMANGEAFEHAVELAKANPTLGIGCHLAAVGGPAVLPEVSSLVDRSGLMPKTLTDLITGLTRGIVKYQDIEREFTAQVERLISAGLKPTHLDTHKHTAIHPLVAKAMARVANEFAIKSVRFPFESFGNRYAGKPVRAKRRLYFRQRVLSLATAPGAIQFKRVLQKYHLRTPDYFCGVALTGLLDSQVVCRILGSLRDGVTELMCHPALYDQQLETATTRLKRERQQEFEALTDATVLRCVDEQKIALMSYAELG
jgi:chitin disaccharide deacetylase